MKKDLFKDFKQLVIQAEIIKKEIAERRDKLRNVIDDLEAIQESLDLGTDSLEEGILYLDTAADQLSQYL